MESEQELRDKINILSQKIVVLEQIANDVEIESIRLGGGEVTPPSPPIPPAPGPDLLPVLNQMEIQIDSINLKLQKTLGRLRGIH